MQTSRARTLLRPPGGSVAAGEGEREREREEREERGEGECCGTWPADRVILCAF
jgi:hypothetical protein